MFLGISLIEHNRTYFWVILHWIVLCVILHTRTINQITHLLVKNQWDFTVSLALQFRRVYTVPGSIFVKAGSTVGISIGYSKVTFGSGTRLVVTPSKSLIAFFVLVLQIRTPCRNLQYLHPQSWRLFCMLPPWCAAVSQYNDSGTFPLIKCNRCRIIWIYMDVKNTW